MTDSPELRIVFAGTPEFAAAHLRAVLDSPYRVVAVYTQPDRPAGRGKTLTASPVKNLALERRIPVYQPTSLKTPEEQQKLAQLEADVMVVVAYGMLLPKAVLGTPRYGCINVHASLLPRWRGAAPIQRALEAGDTETGATIMQMDEGLDTGAMLLQVQCPILPTDTAGTLHDRLLQLGAPALLKVLMRIQQGTVQGEVQDDTLSCYARKITKEEAAIDWSASAAEIDCRIRAFNPFPIAHTRIDGETIRIWEAEPLREPHNEVPGTLLKAENEGLLIACGQGALRLTTIQLPGKKALPVNALLNGYRHLFVPGRIFGH